MIFKLIWIFDAVFTALCLALIPGASVWSALLYAVLGFLLGNLLFALTFTVNGLLLPVLAPGEPIRKQRRLSRWICANVGEWLCGYSLVRVEVVGREKLPKTPFLFVSNHRSAFDPLSVISALREYNISFITKPSNLKVRIVDSTTRHAGYLAIDRENNREALKTILTAADYLKRGLCSIGIYPEGTRSRSGELLPFHAGSFKIAQKAGVPVAIVCTSGAATLKKRRFPGVRTLRLEVLEVLEAERVCAMSTAELAEEARSKIAARLEELKKEGQA
ncbi:MAG: 1-acyl-sn-glycerol-3-phosphate acyltransferase [Oscillospiraceae bacterium]|nr:1-acyl-sn-glycerol-3-phosphate acyltransferase [Oscillospiraceae bacterium]